MSLCFKPQLINKSRNSCTLLIIVVASVVGITAYSIRKRSIQLNNSKSKLKLQNNSNYNINLNNAMNPKYQLIIMVMN